MGKEEIICPGRCVVCGGIMAKAGMSRHLKSCREKNERIKTKGKEYPAFHLLVEGRHLPEYWLQIAVPIDFSLQDVDQFLRDIWLECCGHLSEFVIRDVHYWSNNDEYEDEYEDMGVPLSAVLDLREKFFYDYDFGTNTRLALRVVGMTICRKKEIVLLARNEPPPIPCGVCGRNAERICAMCSHMAEGWLCYACSRKHRCEEPHFLPLVNSPRTGCCGYTGAAD